MRRVTRLIVILVVVVLAGCGSTTLQGVLSWKGEPATSGNAVSGQVDNTTSHSVNLDPKSMRLLDDRGRKVPGHFTVGTGVLPSHQTTSLHATWKSGRPVRIDYGAGTLALPSP